MESTEISRSVIITGAAQGIGKAIALRVLREGWQVIATDKNDELICRKKLRLLSNIGGAGSFFVDQ
ncbi:MAG: SDR family NAD(P)-dependent oxidoreductase [Candidatus Obscuribacterales bacterium]|nr:SDR family NAD(P)-dependent oxidoreductase [Candidatus Obscuribacterales bacterium]